MIAEPVLNGLLHLFALTSSQLPETARPAARQKTQDYLNQHLGLADAQVYIGLFEDLLSLHEGEEDEARCQTAAELAESLKAMLLGMERFASLLHLLELTALAPQRPGPRRLALILGQELGIEESTVGRIMDFISDPGAAAGQDPDCRRIEPGNAIGFRGTLSVLRLKRENLLIFSSIGEEPVWMEGRPLGEGCCRLLLPGQLLRDSQGNERYHAGILAAFQDGPAGSASLDFRGNRLQYRFPGSDSGLHDFSFSEHNGRLVGIMGGSGSGKSTLLGILNGTLQPASGEVLLNGCNIHSEPEAVEGVIGFVPQDDLLFEDLTVYENLRTAARLCMAHRSKEEIDRSVRALLAELGQADTADLKVGSPLQKTISGGQRKRLNIALELIREPTVLFVDEPTSGLSSADSEIVMSLLKEQSARNRLVFVVIHQPSSKIFRMFDALWILDQGGRPIFSGTPLEAVTYFRRHGCLPEAWEAICPGCGGVNPEQIFEIIEARTVDQAGQTTRQRRVTPEKWHSLFQENLAAARATSVRTVDLDSLPPPPRSLNRPSLFGQLRIFFERDLRARLANRPYLLINLLEPILLGLLTGLVSRGAFGGTYSFHDNNNLHTFFFMSVIVAVFLGLSVSAEEICRDGRILQRERFLHLSWGSYIHSKSLYLALVTGIQMLLFVAVANPLVEVPGMMASCWAVLFLCAFCSAILGLNISASFRSAVTIYILIPMMIIPQMLLSGVVIPYNDLIAPDSVRREVPLYANILPPRWGYEALVVEQYLHNRYLNPIAEADGRVRMAEFDLDHYLPELLSILQGLPLLRRQSRDAETGAAWVLLTSELARLSRRTGIPLPAFAAAGQPPPGPEAEAQAAAYLAACRQNIFELRRQAAAERKEILDRRKKELGADGLDQLVRMDTNRSIEQQALNLQELEPIGRAPDGLFQRTLPVYRQPESGWGMAHFLSGKKRLGEISWPTFRFNLAAIAALTVLLYLLLWARVLPSLIGDATNGRFRNRT